ncbi:hypothetical protein THAOC_32252 [Thalassiosira oceanica]|uniref:Uncharacterized protein n=1 Tax=Thalassiosira oceanica TaxID=159749 RepID=K0R9K3_THAOC|nr:hypothetical protein THAOC_32252 [Thalassiosira oceanica]|eukprot:EJK48914.1 hypothetical protein THAOC_32252 [Thalassiosira oceanica]
MSSQAVDCNALEATTSIEDITGNEHNRDILRALQKDELFQLWLCTPDLSTECDDYELGSSRELEWLGHFVKKSTRVFPRMAALREVVLHGNSLDDDCTRLLAQGLSDCKQMQSLFLSRNIICDNGLDVLVQRLPTSVDALYLARNDITLARHVLLLRFRVLNIWGNALCPGGTRVIAASLANPECRLESLISIVAILETRERQPLQTACVTIRD